MNKVFKAVLVGTLWVVGVLALADIAGAIELKQRPPAAPTATADLGGVPFLDAAGNAVTDPANLRFDDNKFTLGVGTNTPNAGITVSPLNASTTGLLVNSTAAGTADLGQFSAGTSTNTRTRIGAQGQGASPGYTRAQVNTLVPDFAGGHITVINYNDGTGSNIPWNYVDCVATGTAAGQFAVANSTGGVGANGCGTNR